MSINCPKGPAYDTLEANSGARKPTVPFCVACAVAPRTWLHLLSWATGVTLRVEMHIILHLALQGFRTFLGRVDYSDGFVYSRWNPWRIP